VSAARSGTDQLTADASSLPGNNEGRTAAVAVRPGSDVFCEISGKGAAGYVLLHGWCCDHVSMRPIASHLAARGRVANMDLRGHGRSTLDPAGYTSTDVVGDMAAVIKLAGLTAPLIIGHSLGAKFALAFACSRPREVRAIVLLDTSIVESRQRQATRLELAERGTPAGRRARLEGMFLPSDGSAQREQLIAAMLGTPVPVSVAALRAGDEVDTAKALASSQVPVLYIAASRPMEDPALMRNLYPPLSYGQVVGSGHFVQLDAADQVNAMIDRFDQLHGHG
jgi:pimeloyl-ACP methyl ester carboxylesterase